MHDLQAFLRRWAGPLAILLVFLALGWRYWSRATLSDAPPNGTAAWLTTWILPVVVVCLIGWFLYGFTNCFPRQDWERRTQGKGVAWERRNVMVIFAYVFTLIFLLFPLWGHLLINSHLALYKSMKNIPMGVLVGCAEPSIEDPAVNPPKKDLKSVPKEIRCNVKTDQWVVNIGGRVLKAAKDSPPPKPVAEEKRAELKKKSADSKGEGKPAAPSNEAEPAPDAVQIQGGLVVPLYFIILALMGAAVSLARRVPEIQKRSEVDYAGTDKEPKLVPGEVRENLAFQLMQFISAPLIAIAAYHVIEPDSRTASVALGFTSGFASESILLIIRGIVNGVKPQTVTPPPPKGTVSGAVTDKANLPVVGAALTVVGQGALKAQTDTHGFFVIHGLPTGEQVVEVTLAARSAKGKCTIEGGRTTACHIELP